MTNLISSSELQHLLGQPDIVILDCQTNLTDREQSAQMYLTEHLPGAIEANLEADLSSEIIPGKTGRHPLPSQESWQETLRNWGICEQSQIIVYDQSNSMFAARAWWMLRWAGLSNVRVLNGGLAAWKAAGLETTEIRPETSRSEFNATFQGDWTVSANELLELSSSTALLDARALPRYKGAEEPLDAKAGHIPDAQNADFTRNLDVNHQFLSKTQLEQRFKTLSGKDVICYCGSGVTACHNILAISEAGLTQPKLYPGSWSEWIVDDQRPVNTGIEGQVL